MVAVSFGLRALRGWTRAVPVADSRSPYRDGAAEPIAEFHPNPAANARTWAGAVAFAYVGAWWFGWDAPGLPSHSLAQVAVAASVGAAVAYGYRRPVASLPTAVLITHAVVQHRLLSAPATTAEWGTVLARINHHSPRSWPESTAFAPPSPCGASSTYLGTPPVPFGPRSPRLLHFRTNPIDSGDLSGLVFAGFATLGLGVLVSHFGRSVNMQSPLDSGRDGRSP